MLNLLNKLFHTYQFSLSRSLLIRLVYLNEMTIVNLRHRFPFSKVERFEVVRGDTLNPQLWTEETNTTITLRNRTDFIKFLV